MNNMSFKARESSLWYRLQYSEPRTPRIMDMNELRPKFPRELDSTNAKCDSPNNTNADYGRYLDEKSGFADLENNKEYEGFDGSSPYKGKSSKRLLIRAANCLLIAGLILFLVFGASSKHFNWNSHACEHHQADTAITNSYGFHRFRQLQGSSAPTDTIPDQDVDEKFEIHYPHVVQASYGESLELSLLLDYEFGNSWNKPAIVDYKAPKDLKFNKVVLTLDTTVGGVQYDRLAHLFLNGVTLWRTSTIEPGGNPSHSNFAKDVSEYLVLFKEDGELSFQLNNIVNDDLTGVFHIKLYIDYYLDEAAAEEESASLDEAAEVKLETLVSPKFSANKIVPFGKGETNKASPLYSLPSDTYKVKLPEFPVNTTRLELSVFASGNGKEEFWYTNVLDKYVDKVSTLGLLGHGPVRFVEVKFNDEIIALLVPEPVIFTGGFSPALWDPMVSISAFDLRSLNVDLTGLLPKLFTSLDNYLEVRVSTGDIDDDKIGSDWILSGNLHIWESPQVVDQFAIDLDTDHKQKKSIVDLGLAGIEQVIDVKRWGVITSEVGYKLKNGLQVVGSMEYHIDSKANNVQYIPKSNLVQDLVYSGTTTKLLTIKNKEGEIIKQLKDTIKYPMILSLTMYNEAGTNFKAEIVNGKSTSVDLKSDQGETVQILDVESYQNGSSVFFLSPHGNHGFGKLESWYSLNTAPPMPKEIEYSRHIRIVNETTILDDKCDSYYDPTVKCPPKRGSSELLSR